MIVVLILIILTLCVTILGILVSLLYKKPKEGKSLAVKRCMKKGYAVITLYNNGKAFNFLIDSASNVSHICSEYINEIKTKTRREMHDVIDGFAGKSVRNEYCVAQFTDRAHNRYEIIASISDALTEALKGFEVDSDITIHGLLGTPFLKKYQYVIDYESLKIYPKFNLRYER